MPTCNISPVQPILGQLKNVIIQERPLKEGVNFKLPHYSETLIWMSNCLQETQLNYTGLANIFRSLCTFSANVFKWNQFQTSTLFRDASWYVCLPTGKAAQLHRSGKYFQEHAYFQPFFSNASNVITHPQRRVIWGELWKCTLLISLGKYSQELWHIFSHELQEFNWVVRVQMACMHGLERLWTIGGFHLTPPPKMWKAGTGKVTKTWCFVKDAC